MRVSHFGDFGQRELRTEQREAIGQVDLLMLPVGAGPTIGASQAHRIVDLLSPRWVVPMHYKTHRISFLESATAFLELASHVHHLDVPSFDTAMLPTADAPLVVVPAAP
jgi:L-ascorbate metabolism protein UlaG (beta-lactamase superfamily)